jgi:hypothetical protein
VEVTSVHSRNGFDDGAFNCAGEQLPVAHHEEPLQAWSCELAAGRLDELDTGSGHQLAGSGDLLESRVGLVGATAEAG